MPQAGMVQGVSGVDARKLLKCHMELYSGERKISEGNALPLREKYLETCVG